jgi:hypothetical protein
MACMGPTISEKQITTVYNNVLAFLREKHNIFDQTPEQLEQYCEAVPIHRMLLKHRKKGLKLLKEALREVIIQDACENF